MASWTDILKTVESKVGDVGDLVSESAKIFDDVLGMGKTEETPMSYPPAEQKESTSPTPPKAAATATTSLDTNKALLIGGAILALFILAKM